MNLPDLHRLIIYRGFLEDPVFITLLELLDNPGNATLQSIFMSLLIEKAEENGLQGNLLNTYFLYQLSYSKNIASDSIAAYDGSNIGIRQAIIQDLRLLWPFLHLQTSNFVPFTFLDAYIPIHPKDHPIVTKLHKEICQSTTPERLTALLLEQYCHYGSSIMAHYAAFRIDHAGDLAGIASFPSLDYSDIIGCDQQKEILRINTENFISGKQVNNVLLIGPRGTGKSTSIMALVNMYYEQGLRLIQVMRDHMPFLSSVMEAATTHQNKKFIFYFDDFFLNMYDDECSYLKSFMDGGMLSQPNNIIIYATANLHPAQEKMWNKCEASYYHDHCYDDAYEGSSLADRFGLILHYSEPTQADYLKMIDHKLKKAGAHFEPEKLRIEGLHWEMEHSGRNGRIANQFVKWYMATHPASTSPDTIKA